MRIANAALALLIAASAANAQDWQWPENPKNLKVLEGFDGKKLSPVMRGFTRALGVRCTYCHVGEEGKPLSTYDFVSDANPNKDRARGMLRMLGSINDQLKAIPASGERRVNMWCHTCHAGRARPFTLEEELHETFNKSGLQPTLARYRALREKYYGKAGYDFSERSLTSFGSDLLREGSTDAAIEIFRLNAAEHPQSTLVWDNLAEGYLKAGKPRLAAIFYRKALELEPENENAMAKLKEIESKPLP
jgi:tetratricopeptide (TPR) repeat protein